MTVDWRQVLIELRETLQATTEAGDAASDVVELDQSKVGRLSRMDAIQAQAMALSANQRREGTLQKIEAALLRVESGQFGTCEGCDEAINPKRLEFDPTLVLCIRCANKADRH